LWREIVVNLGCELVTGYVGYLVSECENDRYGCWSLVKGDFNGLCFKSFFFVKGFFVREEG
jgi:hypothetical protein